MRRMVIVGATGFIGESLAAAAREKFTVVTMSRGLRAKSDFPLDLSDPQSLEQVQLSSEDIVLFLAAQSSPDLCALDFEGAWAINVTGTAILINRALAAGARVLFCSTDSVYGEAENPVDELSPCHPVCPYGKMKRTIEEMFVGDPLFKAIRISYTFALLDKLTSYILSCYAQKKPVEVYEPFYRCIVYRDDVVRAFLALSEHWDTYPLPLLNAGGPERLSRIDVVESFKEAGLTSLEYRIVEAPPQFFQNRPRIVTMVSPHVEMLTGMRRRTLTEAAEIELGDYVASARSAESCS